MKSDLTRATERLVAKLPMIADYRDHRPVVAVVKLHGVITPLSSPVGRPTISTHAVDSVLSKAFARDRLVAVALSVNSPGGAATQSAMVADRIRALATEKGVPVLAFCEDVVASGGYWLACAADEIYAHATSLVGSIGVVSAGFGLAGLIDRLGVERRVHTAGDRKVRLDPFRPEKSEDVQWLAALQEELHRQFIDWVCLRRGSRVDTASEELFSGEVWTGVRARELGLVDGLGTLRRVVEQRYPGAHVVTVEPRRPLLTRLGVGSGSTRFGLAGPADHLLSALEMVEHRAAWSRFGL